jgi:hypothetical protein
MMNPIPIEVTSIDFAIYDDEVVLTLCCDDGTAYEMGMVASQGVAIGTNIVNRCEDVLYRRRPGLAYL